MRRREFIAISFSSFLYNYFFLKRKIYANNLNIESILNLPNEEPSDFYSAELIKDTFYLPVKSKSCIITFNRKTSNQSKITLPINTEPDIVFFSKKYGLFIGFGSSYK